MSADRTRPQDVTDSVRAFYVIVAFMVLAGMAFTEQSVGLVIAVITLSAGWLIVRQDR